MAIFARLVIMLFAIVSCSGFAWAWSRAAAPALIYESHLLVGAVGAVVGVFAGWLLGRLVVGKPAKD
jgi:hypothetical protein